MNVDVLARAPARSAMIDGIVDCDIHPSPRHPEDVLQFLPERWRAHEREYGSHQRIVFSNTIPHPRMAPHTSRLDAWPPAGGPPASDLAFLREHYLDQYGIARAVLQPLRPNAANQRNAPFGAALCAAVNDWQADVLMADEKRLRGSIVVHPDDPELAVAEIERCARRPGFVQVSLPPRCQEPLGRRRFRPILAAAAAHGLPVGLHVSGVSGHASTAGGWPSYYMEEHHSLVEVMQAAATSLIVEGVFEELPGLRIVMIESGIAWLPSLRERLDRFWRRLRSEVPHLRRPPSEYLRDHFWFTTQPIDEPERPEDLLDLVEQVGVDRLMLSTDYPHWDFDDPAQILRELSPEARRAVFRDNAHALYGERLR